MTQEEILKCKELVCELDALVKTYYNEYLKNPDEEYNDWRPDWESSAIKYTIRYQNNNILKRTNEYINSILCFPTEEMRDAFYENFKSLIESYKELL